jgi:glycine oxidase
MPQTVLVVGGGVIGVGIAWRCAQRGSAVTVVDPHPGAGASAAAAGMLAPVTELNYGEQALLGLNVASARRYPQFVAELQEITGHDVGYRRTGALVAAWDQADLAGLRDLHAFGASLGVDSELLTARELRQVEPGVATGLAGGLFARDDHHVDNRALHAALLRAAMLAGVEFVAADVGQLLLSGDRARGARTVDGTQIRADVVVLAAGAWMSTLPGLPPDLLPTVRPVKGQTVRLRLPDPASLGHLLRGRVKGSAVYVVPRVNGETVVGASSEEVGFDVRPRAGAVYELLRDAQSLLPLLSEAELIEVSTGLRPATADNAPIVGATDMAGLFVAAGHYRNGILLTPITADGIAELIDGGRIPDVLAPFAAARFSQVLA